MSRMRTSSPILATLALSAALLFVGAPSSSSASLEAAAPGLACPNARCDGFNACKHTAGEGCCINEAGTACATFDCSAFETC